MSERSISITENDGAYRIYNSTFNSFELLGLLEQVIFDLKQSSQTKSSAKSSEVVAPAPISQNAEVSSPATKEPPVKIENSAPSETVAPERISGVNSSAATDLRTRIGNAVKAIRDLDGKVETIDLSKMDENELRTELEELTAQYKRLKSSKGKK